MRLFVLLKCQKIVKCLATRRTAVNQVRVVVLLQMDLDGLPVHVSLVAEATAEGLAVVMADQVAFYVVFACKTLGAERALVWSVSCK